MSLSSSPIGSVSESPVRPNLPSTSTGKPDFSTVEKQLIAKLRSKAETKIKFTQGLPSKYVDQPARPQPVLPPFYSPMQLTGQQQRASAQQQLLLFHKQVTDLIIPPPKTAATKPYINPIQLRPHLAPAAKRIKTISHPESSAPSQQDMKSLEPVQEQKQSRTQQIPQQRKAMSPLGQPEHIIPPQRPPFPKQQFALPTREQTSLAEQRRREAKKETPITFNEREMSEKEIHYSKSLLVCFLSGQGDESSDEAVTMTKRISGYNDATSRHVDSYQHDTSNHSMAYHYSVPTSYKKRKWTPPYSL
ncbi:hypothetical protein ACHAW5_003384 [Stephanodiscus triporus]|uniref:Uncharacterized protein n=1 Tax=Stephanodiscus triporus TaxID=2934178 RepID=A0ABD3NH62_9STRA